MNILNLEYLPKKPYCTDRFEDGLRICSREYALKKKYIQLNPIFQKRFMIFDLDYSAAAEAWVENELPCPNFATINRENGHAHYVYILSKPVYIGDKMRDHPFLYYKAVLEAYQKALNADVNYSGLMTKNPFHTAHLLFPGTSCKWELGKLADFVDLNEKKMRKNEDFEQEEAQGRNCYIFKKLRLYAYQQAKHYRHNWLLYYNLLLDFARERNNDFDVPLRHNEVKSIVKSVYNYVRKNDQRCYENFIKRQSRKGKKSKGGGRPSSGEPWKNLNISRRTYFRKKKIDKQYAINKV